MDDLLILWNQTCDGALDIIESVLPKLEIESALLIILDSIEMIIECRQDEIDSVGIVANEMMTKLENLRESTGKELTDVQIKILQLVTLADPTFLTQESDLFKNALDILFKVNSEESFATLSKILIHSNLFENNEAEIDVWLDCFFSLDEENRKEVSKSLIKCICQAFNKQTDFDQIPQNVVTKISEKESILLELMERNLGEKEKYSKITSELLTPMLQIFLEFIPSLKKKKNFINYISDVVINLVHFYSNKDAVISVCENFQEHLPNSVKEYLEYWKGKNGLNVNLNVFSDELSRNLIEWLLSNDEKEELAKIFQKKEISLIKRFLLFKMVVSYLVHLSENDLNEVMGNKFKKCLSYLIDLKEVTNCDSYESVLASDILNYNLFYRKCVNSLVNDSCLLQLFNIFEKNESIKIFNEVLVKILMKDSIKKMLKYESVIDQWKTKFLRQLKSKIKRKKNFDVSNLEDVLNFFDYDLNDSSKVLEVLFLIDGKDLKKKHKINFLA